jgi:peroxiredoxin
MEEKLEEKEDTSRVSPFVIAIVAVAIVVVTLIVLGQRRKFEPVVPGTNAIDFTLPALDGVDKSFSEYQGKVVFLNFWATWCKPCEQEMPSMQLLHTSLKDRPFEMVAVSVDSEGPDVVRAFVEKYKLTFTVLHDRKGRVRDIYKTTGVPETFIIDQNGVIAEKSWGPRDWSMPENIKLIKDLLNNGPKPASSYLARKVDRAKDY